MMQALAPLIAAAALLLASAASATPPFEQARSLAFINARGGLLVERVFRKNGGWWLDVQCNVSGIKSVSTTPSTLHAGLAWSKSVARVEAGRIYLQVFTAMQGSEAPSANCGPARLRRADPGVYQIYYLDADDSSHALGQLEIR
jgi:hypothetical protein